MVRPNKTSGTDALRNISRGSRVDLDKSSRTRFSANHEVPMLGGSLAERPMGRVRPLKWMLKRAATGAKQAFAARRRRCNTIPQVSAGSVPSGPFRTIDKTRTSRADNRREMAKRPERATKEFHETVRRPARKEAIAADNVGEWIGRGHGENKRPARDADGGISPRRSWETRGACRAGRWPRPE